MGSNICSSEVFVADNQVPFLTKQNANKPPAAMTAWFPTAHWIRRLINCPPKEVASCVGSLFVHQEDFEEHLPWKIILEESVCSPSHQTVIGQQDSLSGQVYSRVEIMKPDHSEGSKVDSLVLALLPELVNNSTNSDISTQEARQDRNNRQQQDLECVLPAKG